MTSYPIQVEPLKWYNGDDPKKQLKFQKELRAAEAIANYINRLMETDYKDRASAMITFAKIANNLHLKEKTVQSYLYKVSGSSDNSIEIQNPKANDR